MKILIDGRMWGTKHTGVGRYVENLVKYLGKIDKENNYLVLLTSEDFNSVRLPDNFKKIEADIRHYSLKEQILLPNIIKNINFDIVHFPHFNVPIFINKPFVVTIHDMIMHKSVGGNTTTLPGLLYKFKRFGYLRVFENAIKNSKLLITPSNTTKIDILKKFNVRENKVKVITEGVDNLVKPITSRQSEYDSMFGNIKSKYFIYAGNAYPHKNLERLLDAFKYFVEENNSDASLVVVTKENNFKQRLTEHIKNNEISNVFLFSSLTDDELGYLYSNSLAFIYPSFSEGFGLQGLEAVSNNTLIACSDISIFKETYLKKAIYFNPHDFTSIQTAMNEIYNFSSLKRNEMLSVQKEILENYSFENMAKETLKVYKLAYESSNSLR